MATRFSSSVRRLLSSKRSSWLSAVLTWTAVNHPTRIAWAMARASLRSVLTAIAAVAPFIRRVSMQIAGSPTARSPACSHGDSGPASSPRRAIINPVAASHRIKSAGSDAALPSMMMVPSSSTTQMAVS